MITHDLPLKAFSLQPIYLSSYKAVRGKKEAAIS